MGARTKGWAQLILIYTFQTSSTGTATGAITLAAMGPEVKYRSGVNPTALESGW